MMKDNPPAQHETLCRVSCTYIFSKKGSVIPLLSFLFIMLLAFQFINVQLGLWPEKCNSFIISILTTKTTVKCWGSRGRFAVVNCVGSFYDSSSMLKTFNLDVLQPHQVSNTHPSLQKKKKKSLVNYTLIYFFQI